MPPFDGNDYPRPRALVYGHADSVALFEAFTAGIASTSRTLLWPGADAPMATAGMTVTTTALPDDDSGTEGTCISLATQDGHLLEMRVMFNQQETPLPAPHIVGEKISLNLASNTAIHAGTFARGLVAKLQEAGVRVG